MGCALTHAVLGKRSLAGAEALIVSASVAARLKSYPFTRPGMERDWRNLDASALAFGPHRACTASATN